jgi:glycosyltransferase involved in cell wall biosynthesis
MTTPDVSIIVITYNDASRLPRALASAQNQTLRNLEIIVVDDASTDSTPDVLAAVTDPRVRSIRLEKNSGGCSAPRNAGLEIARGTWVMFCDSDDELEMHAAKNLLIAAEQADADMACGVAERVDIKSGKTRRWRSEYHQPGVVNDLSERPGLLFDTICVNKIYRRMWLGNLRFIDGLLYEDQLFTLQCYLRAHRIAIIDPTVYYWYVEKLGDSITQRRDERRNIENRIAINQLIDAELGEHPDIKRLKDQKFLAHEVYLYLRTMERLDDDAARALLNPLVTYLQTLDLTAAADLRPALRVAIYHLLLDDFAGARRAMSNIAWAAVIDMPVVTRDGRDLWGCPHLETGPQVGDMPAEWWLDISVLRASTAPIPQQRPCHRVGSLSTTNISGSTVDAYGNADVIEECALVWIGSADRVFHRSPMTWQLRDGGLHWNAQLSVPRLRGRSGFLAIEIRIGPAINRTAVRWDGPIPDGFIAGEFGTIRWLDDRRSASLTDRIWRRVAARLPRQSALVFGHGDQGRPAALNALTAERAPHLRRFWVMSAGSPDAPPDTEVIEQGSAQHLRLTPIPLNLPLSVIAAHMARIDAATLRATLDISAPVVAYLPAAEPPDGWLTHAEQVAGQVLVQRLDGKATQIPAAMRAWVSDARGMSLAEVLVLADQCVTDSPEMAAFVRALGIPIADQLGQTITGKQPLNPELVAEGEAAVDVVIAGMRT